MTLSNASMQGIQAWIKANPGRQQELFDVNPSYVFFKTCPVATAARLVRWGYR
jgi:membrane-bound lytic murein transglycosylase A